MPSKAALITTGTVGLYGLGRATLAQAPPPGMEWIAWVQELGFLGLLLVFLWGIWRVINYLAAKLFDDEKGYVTTLVESQRGAMDRIAKATEETSATQIAIKETNEVVAANTRAMARHTDRLVEMHANPDDHGFGSERTNRALAKLADLQLATDDRATVLLEEIKGILKGEL